MFFFHREDALPCRPLYGLVGTHLSIFIWDYLRSFLFFSLYGKGFTLFSVHIEGKGTKVNSRVTSVSCFLKVYRAHTVITLNVLFADVLVAHTLNVPHQTLVFSVGNWLLWQVFVGGSSRHWHN